MRNVWLPNPTVETGILQAVLADPTQRERKERYDQALELINRDEDLVTQITLLGDPAAVDFHLALVDRIIAVGKPAHDLFFGRLTLPYDEVLFENVLRYFSRTLGDPEVEQAFLRFLDSGTIRNPGDFAGLLQVLGTNGNRANLEILYGCYLYYKEHFPGEDFHEGPLLGMLYVEN